jgi:PmbA protein
MPVSAAALPSDGDLRQLLDDVLAAARRHGATAADIVHEHAVSMSVGRRLGRPESLTRSEEGEVGLRVFVGRQQAIVSSSDLSPAALFAMAERAVAMAKLVPADEWCGIADPDQIIAAVTPEMIAALDLYDPTELDVAAMTDLADRAEAAAMAVSGIGNSDGASCGYGSTLSTLMASNGFYGSHRSTGFSLSVSVIAGQGAGMETDYAFDGTAWFADMKSPEAIGREAGERAAAALNPRRGSTRQMPIVLDPRIAGSIPGAVANAASGSAIAKGTSIFKDKLGAQIMSPGMTIVDDPFIPRGGRSRAYDDEGLAPRLRELVKDGVLTTWLLDLRAARQLGMQPTGHASRGTSSPPSPRAHNLYVAAGPIAPEDLIADIDEGFYVTEFLGSGGSIVTGDYSRGAKGFWIEKGQKTFPVSEMTIAGNLKEMFMNATPASDLDIRHGVDAPTIRIDGMVVAGN